MSLVKVVVPAAAVVSFLMAFLAVGATPAAAATPAETAAVNWAVGQVGSTSWGALCLSFVYDAYQNGAGVNLRNDTSGVSYNANTDPQDVWGHTTTGITGTGEPPYGALVFFDAKPGYDPENYSHVAIMGAGGEMISTNDAFDESRVHYETLAQEQGSGSYSTYVGWWLPDGSPPGGGGIADGSFVQVSGSVQIYEIAGGAPLYVSNWADVGGSHPYSVISQQQFNSLNSVPANGTFIRDAGSGGIWDIAGGAPLYVSSCAHLGGCPGAINVDLWDVLNVGNPAAHLNPVPANGTFIRDPVSGAIWEVAGGAPMYVSSCANLGGCSGAVNIDPYAVGHLDHLNAVPANLTFIRDPVSGAIWEVAGGAPLYVSSCANLGGCSGAVNIDPYAVGHLDHLKAVPSNGTFLATTAGAVYRVAGGAPFLVSRWSVFGGAQPSVTVDQWDIANVSNPQAHLRPAPSDGTIVEGLPSGSFWAFAGGYRTPTGASPAAVGVDDVGLAAYPQPSPASIAGASTGTQANGSGGTPGSAGAGVPNGGGPGAGTSNTAKACVVPRLLRMTVAQARHSLRQAGCRLGRIDRPRHPGLRHMLRVRSQSIRPGSKRSSNTAIEVTVK